MRYPVEQMIAKFATVISVVKEQAYSSLLGLSSVGCKATDCIQWWYVSGWLLHIGSINDKVKETY